MNNWIYQIIHISQEDQNDQKNPKIQNTALKRRKRESCLVCKMYTKDSIKKVKVQK